MRANEIENQPHLYLDMDGVQADFFTQWARLHNKRSYKEIGDRAAREASIVELNARGPEFVYEFFRTLPPLQGGLELISWLRRNRIPFTVLSAPLRGNEAASIAGKREWLDRYNPGTSSSAIFTGEKYHYARRSGQSNILIDDFKKYVKDWRDAGGQAILYRDNQVAQVIDQLARIYGVDQQERKDQSQAPSNLDETVLRLTPRSDKAQDWIKKVYAKYPHTMQNNHVMVWGTGNDKQFAMFELVPSFSKHDAVEIKWFQAYPLRQGVGGRAMRELQNMAREDDIALTLFPWDKGQVSQAKLTKFYKQQGFKATPAGSRSLVWEPNINRGQAPESALTEVADQPYPWTQTMRSGQVDKYRWQAADGAIYSAMVAKQYQGPLSGRTLEEIGVGFGRTDPKTGKTSASITGTGDAFRVFATIRDIVMNYTNSKTPPEYIKFGGKSDEPSRIALYRRIAQTIQRWLPGYQLAKQEQGDTDVGFLLQRRPGPDGGLT